MRASLDAAGVEHIGLGGVRPNPEIGLAREGVELARANDADIILPVGGGSVMGIYGAYHTSMTSDDGVQTMASRLTEALGDSVIFHDLRKE